MGYVIFYDGTFQCYYFRMLLLLNVGILLDNDNATVLLNVCCYFSILLLMLLLFHVAIFVNVATFPCCYFSMSHHRRMRIY